MNYRKALGTSIIMMIVGMSPIVLSVIITVAANTTDLETYTVTFAYLIGAILCIPIADKGLNIKFREHIRKPEAKVLVPLIMSAVFYEIFSVYIVYGDSLESSANAANGALSAKDIFSVIGLILISPVSEDLIFRYAMLTVLIIASAGNKIKISLSILIVSLFWVVPHYSGSFIRNADIAVVGLVIGALYFLGKNILYCIIFHSTLNTVVSIYALSQGFRKLIYEHPYISYISLAVSILFLAVMYVNLYKDRKYHEFQFPDTLKELSSK